MSRCFPYPPPGYTLSRSSNDALIESIKLQKKKEKVKEQKKKEKRTEKKEKDKRKEKEEKRKEKKEKRKEKKDDQNQKLHKSDIAKSQTLGKLPDTKCEPLLNRKEPETEQLERSDLTQEHGKPVRLDVLPTSSSESTDTSNKRKRQSLPLNDSRVHGNIIRIKLASKKQNDSNASSNEMRICTNSGTTDLASQNKDSNNNLRYGRENSHPAPKTDRERICRTSRPVDGLTKGKNGILTLPSTVMTPMGREEKKYNELIVNWCPPQLLQQDSCLDAEDLDWLFRKPDISAEKGRKIQNDGVSCLSRTALMQPRAQLLSEVNIYALPFTFPF